MDAIDEISLRKQNIFELRNFARDMGVASPTVLKKEELVEQIMRIVNGQQKPEFPKGRQGRPPKNGGILSTDASIKFPGYVIEEDVDPADKFARPNFLLAEAAFNYGNSTKVEHGVGRLKILPNSQGFVFNESYDESSAIFISPLLIQKNDLREGDKFEFEFKNSQGGRIVSKFVKGYFCKKRSSFEQLDALGTSQNSFEIAGVGSFDEGSRNVLIVDKMQDLSHAIELIRKHVGDGCQIVSLRLDAMPEDHPSAEDDFFVNIGESAEKNLFFCSLASSRVKRLVEEGKKVVLVIDELMKLVKYQNFFRNNSIYDVKQNSFVACEALMKLASCYGNSGSVTVVAFCKQNKGNVCQQILLDELENMRSKIINL